MMTCNALTFYIVNSSKKLNKNNHKRNRNKMSLLHRCILNKLQENDFLNFVYFWNCLFIRVFLHRNSVPQSPNFPVANASAHETVLQRVTEMFKHNFPYTTVYPALGNLDVMHPNILQRDSLEEIHHYNARNQRKSLHRKHNLGK